MKGKPIISSHAWESCGHKDIKRKKPWELKPRHVGTGTFKATPKMLQYVDQVLESGRVSYGPFSKRFETEFAKVHGCKYGILSNSGTSSLHVALQALKEVNGWGDWQEVIVPAVTFVATVNVVIHNNLKPIFVDVSLMDYGMIPEAFEEAITPKTVAVIPVHLFGQPCQMRKILRIARDYKLKVIEDSCETMFAKHHGAMVGQMSNVACFSMYNAHIITAGVGGISTTSDPRLAMVMRSLVNHGLGLEELNVDDENFSPMPAVGRSFRFERPGHSYRITELEAALALAQLEDRERIVRIRNRNARHLSARFRYLNGTFGNYFHLPQTVEGNTHSWMMYPILIKNPIERHRKRFHKDEITKCLNDRGIETRDMMPITNQPIFRNMVTIKDFPNAAIINENGFYLGCHQDLEPIDIEYIFQTIYGFMMEKVGPKT